MKGRYHNLARAIASTRFSGKPTSPYRIAEIGTYDGNRALEMARHAAKCGRVRVEYYGFDLFEEMTPERNTAELSKARLPPTRAAVLKKLRQAGLEVQLFQGDTRVTLPATLPTLPRLDLIYCDGGHSLTTTASDLDTALACLHLGALLVVDDYYDNRDDYGCRRYIEALRRDSTQFEVELLEPVDHYDHTGLDVRMVQIRRREVPDAAR